MRQYSLRAAMIVPLLYLYKRSDRTWRWIMSDRDQSDGESLSDQNDCMETRPEDGCIVTLLVSKGGIDWQ